MDAWVWWLIATAVLVVGEMLTTSLVLAMIAGGTAAAGVVAAIGGGPAVQVAAFALVSLALLVGVRPVARRHLRTPFALRTGVASLVGSEAEVVAEVDGRDGRIKLSGEVWSARAYDGQSSYAAGTVVHVVEISGATALVA
ncbi:MAG: NfeD family protein [Frankiales bacterium]|nr:NfeD family protein [Frankiales bacterium]